AQEQGQRALGDEQREAERGHAEQQAPDPAHGRAAAAGAPAGVLARPPSGSSAVLSSPRGQPGGRARVDIRSSLTAMSPRIQAGSNPYSEYHGRGWHQASTKPREGGL